MTYVPSRKLNLSQSNFIPGLNDKTRVSEYTVDSIRNAMPSGYVSGEDMHHLVGVDQFGPFVQNLSPQEARIVINRAQSLGIRPGNDPRNFIGLDPTTEHDYNSLNPNSIHTRLADVLGLDPRTFSGDDRNRDIRIKQTIAQLPVEQRLELLPLFVDTIAEPSIQEGRRLRPSAAGINENKKFYQTELQSERIGELKDHVRDYIEDGEDLTPTRKLNKLLSMVRDGIDPNQELERRKAMNQKRYADESVLDAYRQAIDGSDRADSPGSNRDRSLIVDSGGGDVTIGADFMGRRGKGKNSSIDKGINSDY